MTGKGPPRHAVQPPGAGGPFPRRHHHERHRQRRPGTDLPAPGRRRRHSRRHRRRRADHQPRAFLHRDAFRRTITASTSISTGQPLAVISWDAALHALEGGLLPCASSEQAILRIAASLGDPAIPVRLRTVLGNLDTRTITLVATAITTANG